MEHDLHQPATPEEIWAILREVSKQQAETDRRREKDRQDARKRMNRLEELFTLPVGQAPGEPGGGRPGRVAASARD